MARATLASRIRPWPVCPMKNGICRLRRTILPALRARPMKSLLIFSLVVLVRVAMAEVAYSEPAPTLIPSPAEMEEPALPTAEATPGDNGPTVLPKRDELPARPRVGRPANASFERVSTRPSPDEQTSFGEMQSTAMSNPRHRSNARTRTGIEVVNRKSKGPRSSRIHGFEQLTAQRDLGKAGHRVAP